MKFLAWIVSAALVFGGLASGETEVANPSEEATEEVTKTGLLDTFVEAYFGARPDKYLIDPQGLLSSKDREEREDFLQYHSGDSEIDLFVFLFSKDDRLPEGGAAAKMKKQFFSEGKPAVLAFYFLGDPKRAEISLSPSLAGAVPVAELRRSLTSSIGEAQEKPDAMSQLEAFCVQLSIRIYWMEQAAGLVNDTAAAPTSDPSTDPTANEVEELPINEAKQWVREYGASVGIMGGAILIVVTGLSIVRRRARYRLPVIDVAPRLGGEHAAGIGAVISFANTQRSPSTQRNDGTDSLGL